MNRRFPSRLLASLLSLLTAALGVFVLATWWRGQWQVTTFGSDYVPMAPLTAGLFVLLGLVLAASYRWPDSRGARLACAVTALLTIGTSILILVQVWSALPLPWDEWMRGTAGLATTGEIPVGRMSPMTAVAFWLTAIAVLTKCTRAAQRREAQWLGVYAAGAGFVVGLVVLLRYAVGTPLMYSGQSVPMAMLTGAVFTILNAGQLLAALPDDFGRNRNDASTADDFASNGRIVTRRLVLSAIALGALIAFAGFYYLHSEQIVARSAIHGQLDAIANLKSAQIVSWRNERLGEALFLLRTQAVVEDVSALVARPNDAAARARLLGWLETIKGGPRYESIMVLTPTGTLLLSIPPATATEGEISREQLSAAAAGIGPLFTDIHHHGTNHAPHLDLMVPIRSPGAPGAREVPHAAEPPLAILVLRLNPQQFLFPLIRAWPIPSETAESLLVRREGDEVVFLNELRHRPGRAMTLRRPVKEALLPAAMAARGEVGIREGIDYRGVPVLATLRPIPDSTWILIAKVDQSEVYAPIEREAWQTGMLVALLLVAVVLAAGFEWRQRHSLFLRRQLAVERERSALAERLALITQQANDMIVLFDDRRRIIEVNERTLLAYGYTEDEMKRMTARDLRTRELADEAEKDFATAQNGSGFVFETMHRRKDGTKFPVEVSARPITIAGRQHVLSLIRDVTQRKTHEREIMRLNRVTLVASQVNQAIVRVKTQPELCADICRVLVEVGRFKIAWIGWHEPEAKVLSPVAIAGDQDHYVDNLLVSTDPARPESHGPTGTAFREDRTYVCNDFQTDPTTPPRREAAARGGIRSSIALALHRDGRPVAVLTVYAEETGFFGPREIALLEETAGNVSFALDVLETTRLRHKAEAAFVNSELRYRRLFEAARDGIMILDAETGKVVDVNPFMIEMLGFPRDQFIGNLVWELGFFREIIANREAFAALQQTEYRCHNDLPLEAAEGRRIDVEFISNVYLVSGRKVIQCNIRDISERKRADDALRDSLREKEALLKEVHHRVKNNLQVITSLLRLEAGRTTDGAIKTVLQDMKGRILSMALLHESLYRSGNLAAVDMAPYLSQLATQLFRGQVRRPGAVTLVLDIAPVRLEIDQAIPCGLIVNELASNSLKHGFPEGHKGELRIELHHLADATQLSLRVSDTGIGLPPQFDLKASPSLGLHLVSDLSRQLNGSLTFGAGPGATTEVRFRPPMRSSGSRSPIPGAPTRRFTE